MKGVTLLGQRLIEDGLMQSFDETFDLIPCMKGWRIAKGVNEVGDKVTFGQGQTDARVLI